MTKTFVNKRGGEEGVKGDVGLLTEGIKSSQTGVSTDLESSVGS